MSDLVDIAIREYGIAEVPGKEHNPEVLKYFTATDYDGESWITDETAWCSAFMNWVAMQAGRERTGELNARSWLAVGTKLDQPVFGCVAVLWRESRSSWKGHVGLFIREDENGYWILGGNQGNRVAIHLYPKSRILEFRHLRKT